MKYLVLSPIDVDKSRYYPGEQVELMRYIGDQLVAKQILLPIIEEVAPEPEKKSKPKKLWPIVDMSTTLQTDQLVADIVADEVIDNGSIDS